MADGGITAQFNFLSYKIYKVEMEMDNKLGYLLNNDAILSSEVELSIRLSDTDKYISSDGSIMYLRGLNTRIEIIDKDKETGTENSILKGEFSIKGVFAPTGPVEKEAEENFTKINIPAILMPYLRASMSSVLSGAGFGTVLFPLINIYELAKDQPHSIIEHQLDK
jgi:preprotein translocase subunit SecB